MSEIKKKREGKINVEGRQWISNIGVTRVLENKTNLLVTIKENSLEYSIQNYLLKTSNI